MRWVRRLLFTPVLSIAVLLALGAGSVSSVQGSVPTRPWRVHPDLTSRQAATRALPKKPARVAFLLVRLPGRSELGSPRWGWAVSRHKGWARVLTQGPKDSVTRRVRLADHAVRWTEIHVTVSLGAMRLSVWRGSHVIGGFPIADGGPSTPTPTGRFVVTDRLDFTAGSPYGTFALGLSAHQLHGLPTGWAGGNQVAIHGTNQPSSIGHSVSLGCIHVGSAGLALLQRTVPLGAPVVISSSSGSSS